MDEFRELLRARLKERGALARLAENSGLASHVIGRWRDGEGRPTDTNLKKLAPALGEPYERLAKMCGYLPADLEVPDSDPDEAEMLALYRQIADEHRPTVKSMLRGLPGMRPDSRLTRQRKGLGRANQPEIHQAVTRRRPYQSKSVATMISQYGFQPA